MSYQGWTNYETWAVKLWIDNDHGLYDSVQDMAKAAWDDAEEQFPITAERQDDAAGCLEGALKELMEAGMPEVTGLWADLLNAAMSEVNWREIATSLISEIADEA